MSNPLIDGRNAFARAHKEERVSVNDNEWGVLRVGASGPCLVLMPGTLGRGDIFWQQIEALKDRARILALTYPATGGIAEWAEDIAAIMDREGIESATVLGSSLGGYMAQYFAETHPDRTDLLIAANTLHSVQGIERIPSYAADLDTIPVEKIMAGFDGALNGWAKAHPDQRDLVDLLLGELGGRIPEGELRSRLKALKHGPELPPVTLPPERMVTVEAYDDPLIPGEMRDAVRDRLKPGRAFCFKAGGHFPYVVRPAAYTALLEECLGLAVTADAWKPGGMSEQ